MVKEARSGPKIRKVSDYRLISTKYSETGGHFFKVRAVGEFMDFLFVEEGHRRKGVAVNLLKELFRNIQEHVTDPSDFVVHTTSQRYSQILE